MVLMAEPDCLRQHSDPSLDISGTVTYIFVLPELFEVAEGEVLEDEGEVLLFCGEDGVEADDVWVEGEFLEELDFAEGVH